MQNPESRAPGPVLVLAPSGRDAAVISGLLGQVVEEVACILHTARLVTARRVGLEAFVARMG